METFFGIVTMLQEVSSSSIH